MTPEEIQQQAQMRAMALRGQAPTAAPMDFDTAEADTLSGVGGALAGLGGRSVQAMSQDMVHRGDVLRSMMARRRVGIAKTPEELEAISARAEYERAKAAGLGRAPTADPLKKKLLELKVKKGERELAQGEGGANPKFFLDGYDLSPEAQPSPPEMTSIRKAWAATKTIDETTRELEKMFRQYGNSPLPGHAKARMGQLATDLKLAAKGPEMYALGVIAGPDEALLDKVIPDPTTANATVLDFVGDDQSLAKLIGFRQQAARRFQNSANSLGFKKRQQAAQADGADIDLTDEPGGVTVRRKSDGATKTVPAAAAAKYLKDPAFEEVK